MEVTGPSKVSQRCLVSVVVAGLVVLGGSSAEGQVSRLVPPWQAFGNWKSYPNQAAQQSVALPYIDATDQPVGSGPPLVLTVLEATRLALQNSDAVRSLGLDLADSSVDRVQSIITRYDPLQAEAEAAAEWGIFDPVWTVDSQWNRQDLPEGVSFGGFGDRPDQLDLNFFNSQLSQLLPNGATLEVDFVNNYLFNPEFPGGVALNPQYFTYSQFGIIQPLLQGRGVDVNLAPIRIAASIAEQTDWTFKLEVLALLRSVETTSWELHAAQRNLAVIEEAIPQYREVVRVQEEKARADVGTATAVARARADMLRFEQLRLDTIGSIAEQQLVLRDLLGLATNDGREIRITAAPLVAPPEQSLSQAVETATRRRPDVLRQRLVVYSAQQECVLANDAFRPELNVNAFWRINGLDTDLPGSLGVQADNQFNDWTLGFSYEIPLRRREARANLRAANLAIRSQRALLQQVSAQASFEVADAYRRLSVLEQQWNVAVDRKVAVGEWYEGATAQYETPPAGVSSAFAFNRFLQTLRERIEADISANQIMSDYQSALSRLEEVKGTLLDLRQVQIAGDDTNSTPLDLPTLDEIDAAASGATPVSPSGRPEPPAAQTEPPSTPLVEEPAGSGLRQPLGSGSR